MRKLTPFGIAIKKRLIDMNINQKDLAIAVGTSPTQISYILYGDRSSDRWVEPICQVLEIDAKRYGKKKGGTARG